mgnify:CR=1 FL=1
MWQGLYEGINNANYFLERITDAPVTEENKKLYRGEATFLRAYFYFLLAQSWGDVPLITTAQTNTDNYMPNIKATPQATVLKFVTDEMEKVLNDGENYSIGTIQTVGSGRVSRSAVKGILARVYLKRAGWPTNETELYAKAKYWAGEVINPQDGSMTHSLNLQGYDQVFINLASDTYDPAEVIWEVEFKGNRRDSHTNAGRVGSLICGIQNADSASTHEEKVMVQKKYIETHKKTRRVGRHRYVSDGVRKEYYLQVAFENGNVETLHVSPSTYNKTKTGRPKILTLQKGLFGLPVITKGL